MFGRNKNTTDEKPGFLGRLKSGLDKTRAVLFYDLGDLFQGQADFTEDMLEEIETRLLMADVGIEATTHIIDSLRKAQKSSGQEDTSPGGLRGRTRVRQVCGSPRRGPSRCPHAFGRAYCARRRNRNYRNLCDNPH